MLPQQLLMFGAANWHPLMLGANLFCMWDAERPDLITKDGGNAVSSHRDLVAGYNAVQAFGASQPIWGATTFNGRRPAVTPDGTDDELTLTPVPAGIPTGAVGTILFALVDQTALVADTGGRIIAGWGNGVTTVARYLSRVVVSAQNRIRVTAGDGAASINATLTADFSGRHIVMGVVDGANIYASMDGVASASAASVPATATSRLRMFAGFSTSAASFGQGPMNCWGAISSTTPLGDQNRLFAWLVNRRDN